MDDQSLASLRREIETSVREGVPLISSPHEISMLFNFINTLLSEVRDLKADKCRESVKGLCTLLKRLGQAQDILNHFDRGPEHPNCLVDLCKEAVRRDTAKRTIKYDTIEKCAKVAHDEYERLAPACGYKTREETAVPWSDLPEHNRGLMMASIGAALKELERIT